MTLGFENAINENFDKGDLLRVGTLDGTFTEGHFRSSQNGVITLRKAGKTENTIISLPNTWCVGPN